MGNDIYYVDISPFSDLENIRPSLLIPLWMLLSERGTHRQKVKDYYEYRSTRMDRDRNIANRILG